MTFTRTAVVGLAACLVGPWAFAADSDNDGVDDNTDNCTLVSNPAQRDTDADGYGNLCDGDFNNDGQINFVDLGTMKSVFFTNDPHADLDGDGFVNFIDLGILKSAFFGIPGPTGAHPEIDECNCYFSGDCGSGFCDYGPGSFMVEDICWWRLPKPDGIPGQGCDTEHEGPWGPICDGYCTEPAQGSTIGVERADVVIASIGFWADALIEPSAAGGGPVDAEAAQAAQDLDYAGSNAAMELGRHVADLLSMASDFGFYDYFCHYESHPDEPDKFVDIENDICRINSARLAINALQAELQQSGSGSGYVLDIVNHCEPEVWQSLFAPRCEPGPDALKCFSGVVAEMAVFLSTPRQAAPDPTDAFVDSLLSGR